MILSITPTCPGLNMCFLSMAFNMMIQSMWLVEWMLRLKRGGLVVVMLRVGRGGRRTLRPPPPSESLILLV